MKASLHRSTHQQYHHDCYAYNGQGPTEHPSWQRQCYILVVSTGCFLSMDVVIDVKRTTCLMLAARSDYSQPLCRRFQLCRSSLHPFPNFYRWHTAGFRVYSSNCNRRQWIERGRKHPRQGHIYLFSLVPHLVEQLHSLLGHNSFESSKFTNEEWTADAYRV